MKYKGIDAHSCSSFIGSTTSTHIWIWEIGTYYWCAACAASCDSQKPRTYRQKSRKHYLSVAKRRKPKTKKIRKAVGKQLGYVGRDLKIISELKEQSRLSKLAKQEYRQLLVISELYCQQGEMHEKRSNRIDDRIVSFSKPMCPQLSVARLKPARNLEPRLPSALWKAINWWKNWTEITITRARPCRNPLRNINSGLVTIRKRSDQIYRNREHRKFCKEKGIRLSGPALERPSKEKTKVQEQLTKLDAAGRNAIEEKIGEGKHHYGMGLISTPRNKANKTIRITCAVNITNIGKANPFNSQPRLWKTPRN